MARTYVSLTTITRSPAAFIRYVDKPFEGCFTLWNGLWISKNALAPRGAKAWELMESGADPSGCAKCWSTHSTRNAAIVAALELRPLEPLEEKAKRVEAVAQADSDPELLPLIEDLLAQCFNVFGEIDEGIRDRLRTYMQRPTLEGWDQVHRIILVKRGMRTVWNLWAKTDPGAPTEGPLCNRKGQFFEEWDRIPSSLEMLVILRTACTANNPKQDKERTTLTPVIFRTERTAPFEVTAVFPTLPGSTWDPEMMVCYAHVGQHSACSRDWFRTSTRPAAPVEYAILKHELEQQGYHLEVCQRITMAHENAFQIAFTRK